MTPTPADRLMAHSLGISLDEPELMTAADWPRFGAQLRQDLDATEKQFDALTEAYRRLEIESAGFAVAARQWRNDCIALAVALLIACGGMAWAVGVAWNIARTMNGGK